MPSISSVVHAGVGYAGVWFPSGRIKSVQPTITVTWDTDFRFASIAREGARMRDAKRAGLGVDWLSLIATGYSLSPQTGGGAPKTETRQLGLIGARAMREQFRADSRIHLALGVETSGATTGDAAGYMEILATSQASWHPLSHEAFDIRARVSAGLAGGGAVGTAGGALAKTAIGASVGLSTLRVGVEVGRVTAWSSPLRGSTLELWSSLRLAPLRDSAGRYHGVVRRSEWSAAVQHYVRGARRAGGSTPLTTLGMRVNRSTGGVVMLTAQTYSAFLGPAGAYSVGLVGAGVVKTARAERLRLSLELLAGAGGGGGVATGGGALVQGMSSVKIRMTPTQSWHAGVGGVVAPDGKLASPLLDLGWNYAFGMPIPTSKRKNSASGTSSASAGRSATSSR